MIFFFLNESLLLFFFWEKKNSLRMRFFFLFFLIFFKWTKGDPLNNLFDQSKCSIVNSTSLARKDLKSLKTCNQICFFILKIFRLSLQRQSKKSKAWISHMLGTSKKEKILSLKIWEFLRIWKFVLLRVIFRWKQKQSECLELKFFIFFKS